MRINGLKLLVPIAIFFGANTGHTGEAFRCHVRSFDQSVDDWVQSQPMMGHGMQHFAMKSFVIKNNSFDFDANSNIFSATDVVIRVSHAGFTAISKNHLVFAAPNLPELHVDCENR